MPELFDKVKSFIEHHSMLNGARGALIAVSGGPDSVALLDMLARLAAGDNERPPGARNRRRAKKSQSIEKADAAESKRDLRLCVAHLNHKLRGRESDEDAEFVRAIAKRLGLPAIIESADVRAAAESSGRNVEEAGREIRYNFLLAAARESGCDRIATGHTMSDQAETFLMRLARGAGLRGLAAMRPITLAHIFREDVSQGMGNRGQRPVIDSAPQAQDDASETKKSVTGKNEPKENESGESETRENETRENESKINETREIDHLRTPPLHLLAPAPCPPFPAPRPLLIRPLLCLTREEVEQYCGERGLEFRTDTSNENVDYARNRVRHQVLPALRAVNPRVVEQIARAAEIIAGDQDALDALAASFLDQARSESARFALGTGDDKASGSTYSARALLERPAGLRRRMILEAIRRERARSRSATDSIRTQITSKHVKAVEGLLKEGMSGSRVVLPSGLEVWREFDALVFKSSASREGRLEKKLYERELSRRHPRAEAAGFAFTLLRDQPQGLLRASLDQAKREKNRPGQDWLMAALDDLALPEHLIIRPRFPGERARVIGQGRIKKLKNLMIDHKIPSSRRFLWPVVATPDGRYVWSPGLPPSAEFAARDESRSLAILRASSI